MIDDCHVNMRAYQGSTKNDKDTKIIQKKIKEATAILLQPKANDLRVELNKEGLCYYSAPEQRYLPHLYKQIKPFIDYYKETFDILKIIEWKKIDCYVNHQFVMELLCMQDLCNQIFDVSLCAFQRSQNYRGYRENVIKQHILL